MFPCTLKLYTISIPFKIITKIIAELIFYAMAKSFLALMITVNVNVLTRLSINPARTFQALSLLQLVV